MEPEPEPEPLIKIHQFTEDWQGVRVHGLFAMFTGTVFVWVGDNSRTMPNLSASSSNKYVRTNKHMCTTCTSGVRTAEHIAIMVHHLQSPMPAVSTLMTTTVEQSSVSTERAEAFCQHLAKKLPSVMVLGSYQLPPEPALLHEVVAREVLKRLQPLLEEAAA